MEAHDPQGRHSQWQTVVVLQLQPILKTKSVSVGVASLAHAAGCALMTMEGPVPLGGPREADRHHAHLSSCVSASCVVSSLDPQQAQLETT